MIKNDDLLKWVQGCCTRAKAMVGLSTRRQLGPKVDEYLKQADEAQRNRSTIPAAFPKPDRGIGQD